MCTKKSIFSRAGFTLIEILVATMVLASAMIAIGQMFRIGTDLGTTERRKMIGLNLLQQKLESLKEKEWALIQPEPRQVVEGYPDYEITIDVASSGSDALIIHGVIYWHGNQASDQLYCMLVNHQFLIEPSHQGAINGSP